MEGILPTKRLLRATMKKVTTLVLENCNFRSTICPRIDIFLIFDILMVNGKI